jgi:hypothetical protein
VPGRCARRRNQFSFDQLIVFSIGSVQLRELCNGHQRLRAHVDSLLALGLPWACLGLASDTFIVAYLLRSSILRDS